MKTKSLWSRKTQLAFGSAILTLLIVGAISYRVMAASSGSDRLVRNSHQILKRVCVVEPMQRFPQTNIVLIFGTLMGLLTAVTTGRRFQSGKSGLKHAENALRNCEEKYRMLLDGVQNYAIFLLDPCGNVASWNAGAERIKGFKVDEILGRNFSCFFPPEDIKRGKPEEVLRLAAAKGRHEEQGMRVRKDGSQFVASVTFTALRDPSGNLRGFSEFSHDLTESKESGAKYRGLLEAAPDAMVVVNQSGEIVLLNLQAEKQFGYRRDELIGQKVTNIIPEGFAERLIADDLRSTEAALAQQIGTGIELIARRKDGSNFPIELMLSPLESTEGILVTAAIRDISVRKAAENRLAQMEGKYRGLLEAAPDAMVVVNKGGEIVLLNVQAEKQFGYRRDELLGQKVTNIIPEGFAERLIADDLRTTEAALAQVIGTGIELIAERKDGSNFPIEIMLSPLESDAGILVTAAIRDISVRKAAENHLAQMEGRYRGLLEAAPDAMVVVNQGGEIVLVNVQAEKQFGYRRDELIGQKVKDIIPEGFAERLIADDLRSTEAALAQVIGTGIELIAKRKNGSNFPIEIMLSPLESDAGILVTVAIRDITARKKAEESLRSSEENLRMAVDAAEMGTWFWDIQKDEISWSEKFRALFGLTSNARLNFKEILEVIHPDDRRRVDESVKKTIDLGVSFDTEYRVVWLDSTVHWIAAKGSALRTPEGVAVHMQGIVMDVTERKMAQEAQKHDEARERRSVELKRSNDDLQQFAYIAAHDLQEPLRMVASYTQLLSKRYTGKLDADADEFISFAVDGAHRMQLLIADLLAYCRVGTTGKEFRETSSEIALEQAVMNLQGAIQESGGVVTHDPLPTVVADGAQLQQLFQNVVGNAIKYRSGEVPRVHVSAKRNGGNEWVFSMRDNGLGIDPKYFDKIFVMFQRLHGREEFSGTGIGLTLCKKIAERHGGRMWLDSEPGKGSTFYFAIPDRS